MMDGEEGTTQYAEGVDGKNMVLAADRRRHFPPPTWRRKTGSPSGQQRKIIRQDLQDCAGSLFLPESADEKHVNPVNPV
jgi:hypothetical protein